MRKLITYILAGALILFVLVIVSFGQSGSDQPRNEIEVRGKVTIPTGSANFSGTTNSDQTIDFGRDFSFDNKLGFDVRYIHRSENLKHKFTVLYSRDNWDQQRTLTRSFTFLGQTYIANASADMGVTLRTFLARYSYRWGNEKVHFGPMVDMGVISTNVKLTGSTNNGTRSTEGTITKFAATIGYDLEANPSSKLELFHDLGAIAFQGEHLFHVEGGVKYFVSHHFGVVGGYGFSRYKVEKNDNFVLVRQHGPFFGGVARF